MPVNYVVKQGDCLSSIAHKYGLLSETVWNDPNNRELKDSRKDSEVLLPGDVVYVPDPVARKESGGTETRHRFRRKGVPLVLRLQLLDLEGDPRSGLPYALDIDGKVIEGSTDSDGQIEEYMSPSAKKAELEIKDGDIVEKFKLQLGGLDPIEEDSGLIQRLTNLGYSCSEETSVGEITTEALRAFQKANDLEETGSVDDATRDKLQQLHGT
jgi:hypothetical protein